MERLNWHMADELSHHAEVRVVGPAGSAVAAPGRAPVDEVPLRPLWKFLFHVQWRTWRVARAWRPNVVLAGSGLTAPVAWFAAQASGASTAVYVHGLDLAVRHPVYQALWQPVLRRMDRVIANSRATAALAKSVGVRPERIGIVPPGVDLPTTYAASDPVREAVIGGGGAEFREQQQLGNRPLLLSVGRLSTRKGLREFVVQGLPSIVATYPDVLLLIVGDAPRDALHAEAQTPESILEAAEQVGVTQNLRFLGVIADYRELGSIYSAADVHIFPVREVPGDPEGFGMVALEAAAHGLPTVAFATGGVVDAVEEGKSGCLVANGDYKAFAETVRVVLSEPGLLRDSSRNFAAQFAWPRFGERLRLLIPGMLG